MLDVFLHMKTKVVTVFAKLSIYRIRICQPAFAVSMLTKKMTKANDKQMTK